MAHAHNLTFRGVKLSTGMDIPDGDGHYHLFGDNQRTSTDDYGIGHVHTADGVTTGIPIEINLGDPDLNS